MIKTINRYEHDCLYIGQDGFQKVHWDAMVKLNVVHEGAYFDVLHNGIKFKQFVGVLQIENLLLQIHPKADKDDDDSAWRGVLLEMLKACGKNGAQTAGDANVKRQNFNLLEVYFEDFLLKVEKLLHNGLIKQYRRKSGNVKALKGKLVFNQNIRHNLVHKERFYTTHQVYDKDHFLHQVLALALDIMGKFTRGSRLNDRWRRIKLAFPDVKRIKVTAKSLEKVVFNRKTMPYKRAFELARLIILNYSPDINKGTKNMISLLFDMNQLWEEYVYVQLKKELESSAYANFTIQAQARKTFWNHNSLKPDIVITDKNNGRSFVIDTKWKRPSYSASIQDLRQVYAYARFWKAENVMLLYPGDSAQNQSSVFETEDDIHGEKLQHRGFLRFVKVVENGRLKDGVGEEVMEVVEPQKPCKYCENKKITTKRVKSILTQNQL